MLDFFHPQGGRSWRQFYAFLERLPYWGHYKSTLAMNEAWANKVLDMEERGERTPPGAGEDDDLTPLGYSDIVARLDLIADRVMLVRTATQAGYTRDHEEPRLDPLPRPVTALERERERRARTVLLDVDAMVSGGGLVIG